MGSHAEGGVEEGHHRARGGEVLEEEEDEGELVQEVHAEDDPPEGGVRPDEGAIAELDRGEEEEGEERGVHAAAGGLAEQSRGGGSGAYTRRLSRPSLRTSWVVATYARRARPTASAESVTGL